MQIRPYLFLFLSVFLLGCSVISGEIKEGVDTSLTFNEVAQSPDTYNGKSVLWGGEIIQVLPQENGTTLVEVLEWPLNWREKPQRTVSFQGKFLVLFNKPLDLSRYREGAKITIAGEIQGSMEGKKIKSASDPTYRYPLLLSKEIHVWKSNGYQYSTYEPQRYDSYDPNRGAGILRY